MYTEAKKDIYGTLEESLLFWTKLSKSLEEKGYQTNEYDCSVILKTLMLNNVPYYGTLMT